MLVLGFNEDLNANSNHFPIHFHGEIMQTLHDDSLLQVVVFVYLFVYLFLYMKKKSILTAMLLFFGTLGRETTGGFWTTTDYQLRPLVGWHSCQDFIRFSLSP